MADPRPLSGRVGISEFGDRCGPETKERNGRNCMVLNLASYGLLGAVRWANVVLNPSPTALPGSGTLQTMANGIAGWGLILALIAVVIGAVTWALGSHSQNVHHAMAGRRAVLVAGGAALLIGAAPILINFFFQAGTGLH